MSDQPIDVHYAAQLSRLALSAAEIEKFQSQLGQVLAYVRHLEQVDVSDVEVSAHIGAVFNVVREDEVAGGLTAAKALENAPAEARQLFIVPKVIE